MYVSYVRYYLRAMAWTEQDLGIFMDLNRKYVLRFEYLRSIIVYRFESPGR